MVLIMTQIIRLNDSIIDYSSRPVITQLGEALIAINPDAYKNKFASGAVIKTEDILIDGSVGQIKSNPFIVSSGTGNITYNTSAEGAFLRVNSLNFNTALPSPIYTYRTGVAIAIKFRINSLGELTLPNDIARLFTVSTHTQIGQVAITTKSNNTPQVTVRFLDSAGRPYDYSEPLVIGKIYSVVLYRGLTNIFAAINGKLVVDRNHAYGIDDLASTQIDLKLNGSFAMPAMPKLNLDYFHFSLYGNPTVTPEHVISYSQI